jgi:hypothetical protein
MGTTINRGSSCEDGDDSPQSKANRMGRRQIVITLRPASSRIKKPAGSRLGIYFGFGEEAGEHGDTAKQEAALAVR